MRSAIALMLIRRKKRAINTLPHRNAIRHCGAMREHDAGARSEARRRVTRLRRARDGDASACNAHWRHACARKR
jgi:hypothetical protein